ncbi:hypothetical protein AV521_43620 [Streptomyces sp. IMTB 2501]|uniref:hypothetical protein n=1 Tax=Streptomyces sp. IMTB 2501 TaxID=1776340 RepID=UPI00096CEC68|nr:hypothetical protein [Streptomyces sp. IMTB 2501]OLZ61341.1 hypothetical protein AV521_43620 [Streptomyces sp. IMTB 2501]
MISPVQVLTAEIGAGAVKNRITNDGVNTMHGGGGFSGGGHHGGGFSGHHHSGGLGHHGNSQHHHHGNLQHHHHTGDSQGFIWISSLRRRGSSGDFAGVGPMRVTLGLVLVIGFVVLVLAAR